MSSYRNHSQHSDRSLVLGLDLTAAGALPGSWRASGSRRPTPLDAERLNDLVATAERGALDFVAFDESFRLQPEAPGGRSGGLDAAVIAARIAKRTTSIGLVPTVSTSVIDPLHVAAAAAAVDTASNGRAAWQAGTHIAEPALRAVGRTWRSDGTPPVPVVVRAENPATLELGARYADVVRVLAHDVDSALAQRRRVHEAAALAGRDPADLRVLVELYVVTGPDRASAQARLELVEAIEGGARRLDTLAFVGTHRDLAELAHAWFVAGAADGFVVTPSSLQTDVFGLVDGVVPLLRAAGLFRAGYPGRTLAETLGLARQPARPLSLTA